MTTARKQRRSARGASNTYFTREDFRGPEADDIWTLLLVADVKVYFDRYKFRLVLIRPDGNYLSMENSPITMPEWRAQLSRLLDLPATPAEPIA